MESEFDNKSELDLDVETQKSDKEAKSGTESNVESYVESNVDSNREFNAEAFAEFDMELNMDIYAEVNANSYAVFDTVGVNLAPCTSTWGACKLEAFRLV